MTERKKEDNMCYRKRCDICNKLTYGGCGKHIEYILADVPQEDRCQGHIVSKDDDAEELDQ